MIYNKNYSISSSFVDENQEISLPIEIIKMILDTLEDGNLQKMRLVNRFFNELIVEEFKINILNNGNRKIKKILLSEKSKKQKERIPLNKIRTVKKIEKTHFLLKEKYDRIPLMQIRLSSLFFDVCAEYAFCLNKMLHSGIDQDPFFQFCTKGFFSPWDSTIQSLFYFFRTQQEDARLFELLEEVDTLQILSKEEMEEAEDSEEEFAEHLEEIDNLHNPLEKMDQQLLVGDYWLNQARYEKAYRIFKTIENEEIKSTKLYTFALSLIFSLSFDQFWNLFEQIKSENLKKDLIYMAQLYQSYASVPDKSPFFDLCSKKIAWYDSLVS